MTSPFPPAECVRDKKATLAPADISLLKGRIKTQQRKWNKLAIFLTVVIVIWLGATPTIAVGALIVWLGIKALIFLGGRRVIERNEKLITIGVIASRFTRSENHQRDKSMPSEYVLEIHGKLVPVDKKIYDVYFRRDVVEFHYLESGLILQHRLLHREK